MRIIYNNCIYFLIILVCACNSSETNNQNINASKSKVIRDTINVYTAGPSESVNRDFNDYIFNERLPDWVSRSVILDTILEEPFIINSTMNPFYLEEDFNGDGHLDIALSVMDTSSTYKGMVIIHGNSLEVFQVGVKKNSHSNLENLNWVDIWKINRRESNEPGVDENSGTGPKGELILKTPSIQIEKSEIGGGLIYWNGKQYLYFHQTC